MLNNNHRYTHYFPGKSAFGLLLILMLFLGACSERVPPPMVDANGETLEGLWEGEDGAIATFKGVPFAAPPVGEMRWRAAIANTPRKGKQAATEFAPGCMQTSYTTDWYERVAASFGQGQKVAAKPDGISEDCLYLNVWSPDLDPKAKLPVMVWVHGSMNFGGWSYEPNFLGAKLAARGVVVVTIAYRLGSFGFFAHPALDNGEGEPVANFGWLDIRQAFRWVKQNVSSFGGDPENITGFGESSGAGNLLDWALAGNDEAGLFHRLIVESSQGSLAQRRSLADEQALGERLVAELGLKGDVTARRLRDVSAQDLLDASSSILGSHYFDAVLDGLTMVRQPVDALIEGRADALELIIGSNADEWYMYLDPAATTDDVSQWIGSQAPEFAGSLQSAVAAETDPRKALDRLMTTRDTLCPLRQVAAAISEQGGQAYVYYFSRVRPGAGGEALGAYHGTELPYVFGTHDDWLPTEEVDLQLTDAVMDYWAQFARSGDPNIKGHPGWPTYVSGRPYVMELGEKIRVMEPHDAALCRYLGQNQAR